MATIKEALLGAVADVVELFRIEAEELKTAKQTGKGLQKFTDRNELFLSLREEEQDYVFLNPTTFQSEQDPGEAFGFAGVGQAFDIFDILQHTIEIHQLRGTPYGVEADIKRLCNTTSVTLTETDNAGWELGLDSPGYEDGGTYDLDLSLTMLLYQELWVTLDIANNSGRSDDEIRAIIKKYILPIDRAATITFI